MSNLLLIQNITGDRSLYSIQWSLPYEVQMYLALPAIFVIVRRAPHLVFALLAGAIVLVLAMWAAGWDAHLLQYIPCFLPGVLAYVMPRRAVLHPILLVAIIATAAAVVPILEAAGVAELPLLWAVCLALGFAIPASRDVRTPIITRAAHVVAKYSYGIYLTHIIAMYAVYLLVNVWSWLIFFGVLVVLVRLAYQWIEAPGIALGVRISDRLRTINHKRPGPNFDAT